MFQDRSRSLCVTAAASRALPETKLPSGCGRAAGRVRLLSSMIAVRSAGPNQCAASWILTARRSNRIVPIILKGVLT